MAKKIRKLLVMLLVVSMAAGVLCLPTLAADKTVTEEVKTITNPDGTETVQKTITVTECVEASNEVQ
jgi:hypothetical protein